MSYLGQTSRETTKYWLSNFSGIEAHDDAKASLSSQLSSLETNVKNKDVAAESSWLEAKRLRSDLDQYDPWSSSWKPVSLGGWYSSDEIKAKLAAVISLLPPEAATPLAQKVLETTPKPAIIEAPPKPPCQKAAEKMFGPTMAMMPGMEAFACNVKKIAFVGVILVIIVMAIVLRPYASLGSAILKRPRKSKK